MTSVTLEHTLLLASMLFAMGLFGLLIRRNLIFIFLSLEVMLNASGLAFLAAGHHFGQVDGQVMFLFILAVAASEVAIGLALTLKFEQRFNTLDARAANHMRG